MARVNWSPGALRDIVDIEERLDAIDPSLSVRVVAEIAARIVRISDFPLSGEKLNLGNLRKLSITRFDYIVFYRPSGVGVEIVGVRHARENWRPR